MRAPALSQVAGVPEESIHLKLQDSYSVVKADKDACIVRLSTRDEAERLISQLKEWAQQD